MRRLLARLWHGIRGPAQWRLLWLANATFMVGVTGVVHDDQGRFLLLRHRLWPEGRQWGLPSGYAVRGEEFSQTVVREVREETALTVRPGELLYLRSGFRLRLEVAYEAHLVGGTMRLDPTEILDAGWFLPNELPEDVQPAHRTLIDRALGHDDQDEAASAGPASGNGEGSGR